MMTDPPRTCSTCGLLGMLVNASQGGHECVEITIERRQHGHVYREYVKSHGSEPAEPVCMQGIYEMVDRIPSELWKERSNAASSSGEPVHRQLHAATASVLQEDRGDCPGWVQYRRGLGPSRVVEMAMIKELNDRVEADRYDWEKGLAKLNKRFSWAAIVLSGVGLLLAVGATSSDSLLVQWCPLIARQFATPAATPSKAQQTPAPDLGATGG